MSRANPFEAYHRSNKVALIVAFLPVCRSRAGNKVIAEFLQALSLSDRKVLAKAAGCKSKPSDKTWSQAVQTVRERATTL